MKSEGRYQIILKYREFYAGNPHLFVLKHFRQALVQAILRFADNCLKMGSWGGAREATCLPNGPAAMRYGANL